MISMQSSFALLKDKVEMKAESIMFNKILNQNRKGISIQVKQKKKVKKLKSILKTSPQTGLDISFALKHLVWA